MVLCQRYAFGISFTWECTLRITSHVQNEVCTTSFLHGEIVILYCMVGEVLPVLYWLI